MKLTDTIKDVLTSRKPNAHPFEKPTRISRVHAKRPNQLDPAGFSRAPFVCPLLIAVAPGHILNITVCYYSRLEGQKHGLKRNSGDSERTSRFSGLISLCTMLRPCRYLRALARLYTMALPSLSVYLVEEVIASKRSPPYRKKKDAQKHQRFGPLR